jgi:hypothetical protein
MIPFTDEETEEVITLSSRGSIFDKVKDFLYIFL